MQEECRCPQSSRAMADEKSRLLQQIAKLEEEEQSFKNQIARQAECLKKMEGLQFSVEQASVNLQMLKHRLEEQQRVVDGLDIASKKESSSFKMQGSGPGVCDSHNSLSGLILAVSAAIAQAERDLESSENERGRVFTSLKTAMEARENASRAVSCIDASLRKNLQRLHLARKELDALSAPTDPPTHSTNAGAVTGGGGVGNRTPNHSILTPILPGDAKSQNRNFNVCGSPDSLSGYGRLLLNGRQPKTQTQALVERARSVLEKLQSESGKLEDVKNDLQTKIGVLDCRLGSLTAEEEAVPAWSFHSRFHFKDCSSSDTPGNEKRSEISDLSKYIEALNAILEEKLLLTEMKERTEEVQSLSTEVRRQQLRLETCENTMKQLVETIRCKNDDKDAYRKLAKSTSESERGAANDQTDLAGPLSQSSSLSLSSSSKVRSRLGALLSDAKEKETRLQTEIEALIWEIEKGKDEERQLCAEEQLLRSADISAQLHHCSEQLADAQRQLAEWEKTVDDRSREDKENLDRINHETKQLKRLESEASNLAIVIERLSASLKTEEKVKLCLQKEYEELRGLESQLERNATLSSEGVQLTGVDICDERQYNSVKRKLRQLIKERSQQSDQERQVSIEEQAGFRDQVEKLEMYKERASSFMKSIEKLNDSIEKIRSGVVKVNELTFHAIRRSFVQSCRKLLPNKVVDIVQVGSEVEGGLKFVLANTKPMPADTADGWTPAAVAVRETYVENAEGGPSTRSGVEEDAKGLSTGVVWTSGLGELSGPTRGGTTTEPYTKEEEEKMAAILQERKEKKEAKKKALKEEQAAKLKKMEEEMGREKERLKKEEEEKLKEHSGSSSDEMEKKISEWVANLSLGEEDEVAMYIPKDEQEAAMKKWEAEEDVLTRRAMEDEQRMAWKLAVMREKKRRVEAANVAMQELAEVRTALTAQLTPQVDLQRKVEIIVQSVDRLAKVQEKHYEFSRSQEISVRSMRTGLRDFARELVGAVGSEVSPDQLVKKEKLEEQVFVAYVRPVTEPTEEKPMDPAIAKLLEEFKDLTEPPTCTVSRPIQHCIEIEPGSGTPKGVVYRMSPRELEELRKQLDELLEKGWIRPSSLLRKETIWKWDKDCTSAMKKLKQALIEYPVLKVADPSLPFVVTTDASQYDIGAVLQQDDGNAYRPVEFMSARMPSEKVATSTYERELYALRQALDHWKHYLLGRHFKVYSDHEMLQWLKTQAKMTPKLTRWAAEIDQYDFELKPVKGKYNVVADALSRRADYFGAIVHYHDIGKDLQQKVREAYAQDPIYNELLTRVKEAPKTEPNYRTTGGLLFEKTSVFDRLCIPNSEEICSLIMGECHDTEGHFAVERTMAAAAASAVAMATSAATSASSDFTLGMSDTNAQSISTTTGSETNQMAGVQSSSPPPCTREHMELQQVERIRLRVEEELKKATERENEIRNRSVKLLGRMAYKAALEGLDDSTLDNTTKIHKASILSMHVYMDGKLDAIEDTLDQILNAMHRPGVRPAVLPSLSFSAMTGLYPPQSGTTPSGTSSTTSSQTVASSSSGPPAGATPEPPPGSPVGQQQPWYPKTPLKPLSTFSGDKKEKALDTWLRTVPVWVRAKRTLVEEEVITTTSYLEGSTTRWLNGLVFSKGFDRNMGDWAKTHTLKSFMDLVEARWHNPQQARTAADGLLELDAKKYKYVRELTSTVERLVVVPGVQNNPQVLLTMFLRCLRVGIKNSLASEARLEYHTFETFSKKALDLEAMLGGAQTPSTDRRKKKSPQEWKKKGSRLTMVDPEGNQTELDDVSDLVDGTKFDKEDSVEASNLAAVVKGKAGGRSKGGQQRSQGQSPNPNKIAAWVRAGLDQDAGSLHAGCLH
ncbi:hypothetical protein CBR_g51400 [Chara braunii]|uniref:Reverse transcriptase RNase H-like domain-containing protein n=1 Tax=Chara braunii TaxID=69332 RepID=A0A388M8V6_CHABU|nr:hypothetical protein CBR_g51400 [Chara braunii]|eukprot:GBG90892.1 hypothetical protein CBR_g51400 [Chara braunii]